MARKKDPKLEAQRRGQLLDATIDLLGEMPFHAVTQEGVASRAGVSKGLLTYYFPSKDALFVAAIRRYHEQQRGMLLALARQPSLAAADKLRLLIAAAFPSADSVAKEVRFQSEVWSYAKDRPEARAAMASSYLDFQEACATILDDGAREGFVTVRERDWTYRFIHALIDGLSFQLAMNPEMDLPELRRRLEEHIRALVGAPPGA